MNHASIPLSRVCGEAHARFSDNSSLRGVLDICRVDEVDTKNRLVSAYFLSIDKTLYNIPYCLPMYNSGYGIMFAPTVGSLGVVVPDMFGRPYIIAFTMPEMATDHGMTRNVSSFQQNNTPELLEGEILVASKGRSFMKLNKFGGFMLSSAIFAYVAIDEYGNYELNIENGVVAVNGVMTEEYSVNYEKKMEIIKGIHTSHHTDNEIELCYEIRLGDQIVFGVTTDGRIISQEDKYGKGIRSPKRKRANTSRTTRRYHR